MRHAQGRAGSRGDIREAVEDLIHPTHHHRIAILIETLDCTNPCSHGEVFLQGTILLILTQDNVILLLAFHNCCQGDPNETSFALICLIHTTQKLKKATMFDPQHVS